MNQPAQEQPLQEIEIAIHQHGAALHALIDDLLTRASLQAYTSQLYDQLVVVAWKGIELVNAVQAGEPVSAAWLAQRDALVAQATRLIEDVPPETETPGVCSLSDQETPSKESREL